ncbi:MAG: FAD-dependent oxidoreductase [Trichocoleus desertorum ATA4-8-CV12]|jgi:predicted NAD/FAD-binding protein|nr:FAD-dependent oxidoreductase [Trichocoleus desertorum ATA4-8-CV12]
MKIAIIGAGLSGLAVAYYLSKAGKQVTVFEKSDRIGGNAHTVPVQVGDRVRWVDLGVNDFNAATYTNIVKMLDQLNIPYSPLEDSASFSTHDGSYTYTLDGKGGTQMPESLRLEYERFKSTAHIDVNNPAYYYHSIAQYLQEKGYSPEFGRYNLYPRINGMYFVNDMTPEIMPFRGVMNYYGLQEGFGSQSPKRCYFTQGSSSWIEALGDAVTGLGTRFRFNAQVSIRSKGDAVVVDTPDGSEIYDAVVMACHANTALKLLQQGITQDMVNVLSAFEYTSSVAVAHTFSPVMPLNKNAWRTYNIRIHDNAAAQLRPYSISYVCNRHQNDTVNPLHNGYENPEFFVSLNPSTPIPDQYILRTPEGKQAIAYFYHNVLNQTALIAQENLQNIVQGQNNIFFTGGWTKGAGLHEECWLSAMSVSERILNSTALDSRKVYATTSV